MTAKPFALFLIIFSIFTSYQLSANNDNSTIQTIIHLLDYTARDYLTAVENGKIINQNEYNEMQEFSRRSYQIAEKLAWPDDKKPLILSHIFNLQKLINQKASQKKVTEAVNKVKTEIIEITGFITAPIAWPDLTNGKMLYILNCTSCHGIKGNGQGELAQGLTPRPTNFLNDTSMSGVSPFQAYNTIKLGVDGTGMRGFTELTDDEAWNLAFYIKSLRFNNQYDQKIDSSRIFSQADALVNLKQVATFSDKELLKHLKQFNVDQMSFLVTLRAYSPNRDALRNTLKKARSYLRSARQNYLDGKNNAAREDALSAYLEGIEPSEARLKANAPAFTSGLEQQMFKVRQAIEQKKTPSEVENEINTALSMITHAEEMMKDKQLNYWMSFFLSASIMLREGLEAFLILALILALVRSSGVRKALPWVHGGWMMAIAVGIAGWFFSDWIIAISGKNREIMEGMISLVAVVILAFVGFWLHDHSQAKKWKAFIEEKIGKQLEGEKMFGLAFFSFMVVFREAFESVLFLQAISLETKSGNQSSIGLGVLAAFGLILLFAFLFLKFSRKIPVRQLFRYSAWGITLLALILIGKGTHSMQEAGWLSITGLPISVTVDWLGIFPTAETTIAQIALLCLMLLLYFLSNLKSRPQLT